MAYATLGSFVKRGTNEPDWWVELKFRIKQWKEKEMKIVSFAASVIAFLGALCSGYFLFQLCAGWRSFYASDIAVYTKTLICVLFAAVIHFRPEALTRIVGLAPNREEVSVMSEEEARSSQCVTQASE